MMWVARGRYVYVVEMRRMEGRDVKMPDGPVMMERVLTIALGETECGEGERRKVEGGSEEGWDRRVSEIGTRLWIYEGGEMDNVGNRIG
jgi:hypothetical protein